jgi:hypothetical protein
MQEPPVRLRSDFLTSVGFPLASDRRIASSACSRAGSRRFGTIISPRSSRSLDAVAASRRNPGFRTRFGNFSHAGSGAPIISASGRRILPTCGAAAKNSAISGSSHARHSVPTHPGPVDGASSRTIHPRPRGNGHAARCDESPSP